MSPTKKPHSDAGGKCPNCGAEDKWLELSFEKMGGTEYDYVGEYECDNQMHIEDDEDSGHIERCGCHVERVISLEPEYNPEDAPDFFD